MARPIATTTPRLRSRSFGPDDVARARRTLDELTRREFLAGAVLVIGATACTADDGDGPGAASPSPSAATRVVDSAHGPIEVPADPRRVVALSAESLSTLLDLGLEPVGVSEGAADWVLPAYADAVASLPSVGVAPGANVERVAALDPDLILSVDVPETGVYEELSAIAPTVFIAAETLPWRDLARAFADAVNRVEALDALAGELDERFEAVRTGCGDALTTAHWGIVNSFGPEWNLFFPDSPGGSILQTLGATPVDAVAGRTSNKAWGFRSLSFEQLGELSDADVLLVFDSTPETPRAENQALMDASLFRATPAAEAGHVYVSRNAYPTSYGESLALLDEIAGICVEVA